MASPQEYGDTLTVYNSNVGTTEAALIAAGTPAGGRKVFRLRNTHGSQIIYFRTATGVTSANGAAIPAGTEAVLDGYNGALYIIASGATTTYTAYIISK